MLLFLCFADIRMRMRGGGTGTRRKRNEEKGPSGSVRRSLPANPPTTRRISENDTDVDVEDDEDEELDVEGEEVEAFRMPGDALRDVSRTSAASMDASGTSGDGDSSQVLDENGGGPQLSQSLDSSRTESEGEPNRTSTPREPRDQFPLRERDTNPSDAGTTPFMKRFGMSCIMKMFFTFLGSFFCSSFKIQN